MKYSEMKAIAPIQISMPARGPGLMGKLATLLFVLFTLLFACGAPTLAQNKNIVILAPHPDDEALCCAGIIYNALQQGNNVTIVVVTNGDYYQGVPLGLKREGESVSAMSLLGLGEQKIIFMGYGDEALQGLYQSTSPSTVIPSPAGQTQTYATRGLGGVSYHQYLTGIPGPYSRQTILGDMEAMLQNLQPSDVYTTGLWDDHPDHVATFNFVVEALLDLRRQGVPLSTKVHETLVHAPCGSCGVPTSPNYLWPGGGVGITPTFSPTQPYPQPYYLSNVWPNGSNTPYSWSQIERDPLPTPMQDPNQATNLKAQIIANYKSQDGSDRNAFLYAFVKRDEFFWIRDFTTNIAGLATVTVSSESPPQLGISAVDGFIEGFPGYQNWEWVTQGELAGAWINLAWPTPVTISQVVLYNRQDLVDEVLSGHLTFGDGTTVPVGQLPINGNPYLVSFPPKTVTSMQFTVDNAVGQSIGLTEIEVFGYTAGNTLNNPQFFQGVLATAPYSTDIYGQLLTPTISDAQTTNLNVAAFDVDAQSLNYSWVTDSGVISGAGANALFSPPVVAAPSVVTATVTVTDGQGGTAQTSGFVTVTPSNSSGLTVLSLSVSPSSVQSGSTALATVTLSNVAPQGAVVALSSGNTAVATVPATVAVAPGANSATFPISTTYVVSNVSVNISATLGGVTQVDFVTVLQPPVIVSSVTFNPATVGGGNPSTGTVLLTGPAQGDAVISLTNGSPSVITIPATVTVLSGTTSITFPVTTQPVSTATSVAISAYFVGGTTNVTLRVAPYVAPNLATSATVTVSSQNVNTQQQGTKAIDGIVDGSPGDYTKEWATVGQLAGAWLKLTWGIPVTTSQVVLYDRPNLVDNITSATLSFSDGTTVPVGALPNDGSPLTVTFSPKTTTWIQFTVNTAVGQNIGLAEIAVIGTITQASTINAVSVTPASVTGGYGSTGTVTLNGVAPTGGTVVTLASSDTSSATVPPSVTVPAGSLSATVPITTYSVSSTTGVSISGTYNGTQSALLTVVPVGMSILSLNPNMVQGGIATSTGIVSLTGPAPPSGAVVSLTSNNSGVASVPATITIPAGSTSGTFTITTNSVAATAQVGISAFYNGVQTATLLVTPVINSGTMQQFVVDNFNRADSPLGANWSTTIDSPSVPAIASQQVQSPWVFSTALYYGGINWPADQYAQAQVLQSNNGSSGPAVRMTSNAYYAGTVGNLGAGNANVYIILNRGGGRSIIASSSTATVLANDYLQLTAQGTTLTLTDVTQSETLLTVTDSTISAGYPGLYVGSGGIVANWSAGLSALPPILQTNASDNFNRADSPNLGPNWTIGPGYYPIQIISTQIESDGQGQPPGQGHGKEYYTATTFPSDQWSQAQVIESTNDINGALVRYQGAVDTHYVGFVSMLGAPGTCSVTIDSDTLGSPTVLASDTHYCSVSSGDYLRIQAQGPLLTLVDATTGSLLLATLDSGISGGWPGWSLNPIGGTPIAANWSGGQFSSQSQVLLTSLTLNPQSVLGGGTSTGTVMLNGPAPSGGALIALTSSNTSAAQVPSSVTVAQGASTATFTITTSTVHSDTPLSIIATYGSTQTAGLTVTAPGANLSSVSVNPTSVVGGNLSTGTVTLTGPAPTGGALVTLSSSNPTAAQVPGSVTVAAGASTATFTITTIAVASDTALTISGNYNGPASRAFTVTAAVLTGVSVNPASVLSGSSSTGTVTLNGPAPSAGAVVTLSSSNTSAAQVPANVTVSAGATTATFAITTGAVSSDTSVTISGIYGTTQGASLTVTAITSSISGTISGPGGAGATVSLSGASTAMTTADGSGNYIFMGLLNGSYQVTPSNLGFVFTPVTQTLSINNANATANFTSTLQTYSISGTVSGAGGPRATVVLTGSATATTIADGSGNFTFTGLLNGSYIVTPGNTGYVFTPASAAVVINGSNFTGLNLTTVTGCPTCDTVWGPSAVPTAADSGDPTSMELGVKIRADNDGYITGLRFYKAPNNVGTHVAHVWSSTGTVLGSATVTGESAAGWQQMLFASPIPVVANTTYVASYLAPSGHYSDDSNFFASSGVDNAPLHALANGVDGPNGVFLTTSTGGFPTSTKQSDNYWVDVVYTNTQGYSIAGVISGPGAAGATLNLTGTATASTTADANGNFSFNNLPNGSYTVTPSNGSDVFTPPSQVLTINGAHVMNVTFTSAAPTYSLSGTISGPGGPGATVSLTGTSTATTTADGSGNYSFSGLANGNYTVTPSNAGFVFSPISQSTTVNNSSITGVNFVSLPTAASISVNPSSVVGGTTSTGTVTLTAPAPVGGAVVALSSSNTGAAQVPASVTVVANATTATFTVTTSPVASDTSLSISATYGTTQNGGFTVTAATLSSVTVNPASVLGGGTSSGTVTLNGPAPAGGAIVTLSSSNTSAAQVPSSVSVAANATTATFTVTTSPVATNTSLSISAAYGTTQSASFTVTSPVVASVSVSPSSVLGGGTATGTVTLNGPAPTGGAVVTLSSSNTGAAQVPASVTVAANATSATFTVTTSPVASNTSLSISATYATTQSTGFTVTAAVLSSVGVNPSSVIGGSTSTGTVTLNGPAPAGGAIVTLSSTNTSAAQVPSSVAVAANATTATFTVTTSPVSANTSLTISATYGATQTAAFIVNRPVLSSVTMNPTSVPGGATSTGTVTLTGPAPAGGAVVTLSSNNAAGQVPASVTVPANATTATFTATTSVVASNATVTITATYGATQATSLTVRTGSLSSVTMSPTSVVGGTSSTGTVTLAAAAPAGGAVVTLSSSNASAAQVPASVTVAAGATTASFTVTTTPVSTNTAVTITGTYGVSRTASLTVNAPTLTGNGSGVTVNPTSVIGGTSSTGTVKLTGPAPASGSVVTLSSSNVSAAQVPASVTVPAGATSATFTVTTSPVPSNASVTITGVYGVTRTASLTVTAATLTSVALNPNSVTGGNTSTGTVTLTGPAPSGGAVVTLSSSNTSAAQVPASVTVPANATTATFTITTSPVSTSVTPTISATYGANRTAGLNVLNNGVSTFTLSPTSVVGGTSSTGTVTLIRAAPTGGAVVTLSSNNVSAAQVLASVTVPANATSATFTVTTSPVASNASVTITGTYLTAKTATLTVTAATASAVTVSPTSVIGGTSSTGTVTLNGPAPSGGAVVTLSSNNTAAARVPTSVTVPANATTASFTITTSPVASNASVTITATLGVARTATLTVTTPTLSSLALNPTTVRGNTPSTGTVAISGPAPSGGTVVTLSSNLTSVATVPASVTVPAGTTTATFTVTTHPVTNTTNVTISGTKGTTQTATLTVTP